jgi:glucose dehydrogenase
MKITAYLLTLAGLVTPVAMAADEGLNSQDLMKPLSIDWPTFNGDYSGKRYSSLSQINQSNVGRLTLAWVLQPQSVGIKSTPLEVNGILYFTTPDNVWAADARTGRIIWHYYRESTGDHIGNRGVGMYKDWLYFETPDCHLISLNAKDGGVEEMRLTAPVRPGDTLRSEIEVLGVRQSQNRPNFGIVRTRSVVSNQRNEVVLRATVNFLVPLRPKP